MKLHTSYASLSERNWGFTQCERCKAPHANLCNEGAKCWRERSVHFETLTSNSDHFITNTNKARLGKITQCYHRLHCLILLKWLIHLSLSESKQMHILVAEKCRSELLKLWVFLQTNNTFKNNPGVKSRYPIPCLYRISGNLVALCPDGKSGRSRRFQAELQILLWRSVRIQYVCQCILVEECFIVVQVLLFWDNWQPEKLSSGGLFEWFCCLKRSLCWSNPSLTELQNISIVAVLSMYTALYSLSAQEKWLLGCKSYWKPSEVFHIDRASTKATLSRISFSLRLRRVQSSYENGLIDSASYWNNYTTWWDAGASWISGCFGWNLQGLDTAEFPTQVIAPTL